MYNILNVSLKGYEEQKYHENKISKEELIQNRLW